MLTVSLAFITELDKCVSLRLACFDITDYVHVPNVAHDPIEGLPKSLLCGFIVEPTNKDCAVLVCARGVFVEMWPPYS